MTLMDPGASARLIVGPPVLRFSSLEEGPAWAGNDTIGTNHLCSWSAYVLAVCSRFPNSSAFRTSSANSDPFMMHVFF